MTEVVTNNNKLTPEYQNILLALNLAEELFKAQEEITIFNQEHLENEQELYRLKQDIWQDTYTDSNPNATKTYTVKESVYGEYRFSTPWKVTVAGLSLLLSIPIGSTMKSWIRLMLVARRPVSV